MIPIKRIREEQKDLVAALSKRNIDAEGIVSKILELDSKKRSIQVQLDDTLHELNTISSEIGVLIPSGKTEQAEALKEKTIPLKETSKTLQSDLDETSEQLHTLLVGLPNVPYHMVPKGTDEADNEEIFCSAVPSAKPGMLPHWELAKKYDLIDFELGVKICGAGFPVYKGKGARLQRALISYFLDKNSAAGYKEYLPPHLVNEVSAFGTGQLPDKDSQMYYVSKDNLYLIPTSEVPLVNFFRDNLVNASELPIKCTAYSPCFRREAGSYGAHVRGLNRVHQFDKVELIQIVHPSNSYELLDGMVAHVGHILEELKLPYRKLRLCSGDLGFAACMTIDFEGYSVAQDKWLEISSVSNDEDFQSNRIKLRIKDKEVGENILAHTLNGSSLALARVVAVLLENYQDEKGIRIPDVLVPYTGFDYIS